MIPTRRQLDGLEFDSVAFRFFLDRAPDAYWFSGVMPHCYDGPPLRNGLAVWCSPADSFRLADMSFCSGKTVCCFYEPEDDRRARSLFEALKGLEEKPARVIFIRGQHQIFQTDFKTETKINLKTQEVKKCSITNRCTENSISQQNSTHPLILKTPYET